METVTIHVRLLDEGTDVWRPVAAQHLRDDLYRILGAPPEDEIWEFRAGDAVRGKHQQLSGDFGRVADRLVAFEKSS
jgi:hypothetical protein